MPSSNIRTGLGVLVGTLLAASISSGAAVAGGIQCKGNFQVTKDGLISTPYCQEQQIAIVARSYGWKVTASEVRNNPLKKVELCQILGGDVRLKGSCAGYGPDGYAPIR
jgi:hypothetical protein